jgi:hypothetical protein
LNHRLVLPFSFCHLWSYQSRAEQNRTGFPDSDGT